MSRKAILIESSCVNGQNDLPGARLDIENWKNFLMSELGGHWKESELCILRKPYSSDVHSALDVPHDCYCFVAFSGHGSNGSVVLNQYFTNFSINSLKPKSLRGALIVDACRGLSDVRSQASLKTDFIALASSSRGLPVVVNSLRGMKTDFMLSEAMTTKSATTRASARAVWDSALNRAATGTVQMLACAVGQAAGEDPNAGGYYTSLLLESAEEWRFRAFQGAIHTTWDAHEFARRKLPLQQTPEYSPSGLSFPFAVQVESRN